TCRQPPLFVTVSSGSTVRLVQQASVAEGGSKVQALPQTTVLLVAQTSSGGVVSTMVTVWLHVAELLQQSVACQYLVMDCTQPVVLVAVVSGTMVRLLQHEPAG